MPIRVILSTVDIAVPAADLDHLAAHVDMLSQVEQQITRLKKARDELRSTIRRGLGGAEVGLIGGEVAVTNKTVMRTSLSANLVKLCYPRVARLCMETKPVTTFLLVP